MRRPASADVITEVARIGGGEEHAFAVDATGLDLLLVAWLEELLFRFETTGVLYPRGEASVEGKGDSWSLRARMRGERFDRARHPLQGAGQGDHLPRARGGTRRAGLARAVIFDI